MASFDFKIALGYNWRPNYSLLFYDFAMEPIIKIWSKIVKLTGIDNSWFQINHNSTWNMLACTGWWEKGWEWVIFFSYRSFGNLKKWFTGLFFILYIGNTFSQLFFAKYLKLYLRYHLEWFRAPYSRAPSRSYPFEHQLGQHEWKWLLSFLLNKDELTLCEGRKISNEEKELGATTLKHGRASSLKTTHAR